MRKSALGIPRGSLLSGVFSPNSKGALTKMFPSGPAPAPSTVSVGGLSAPKIRTGALIADKAASFHRARRVSP